MKNSKKGISLIVLVITIIVIIILAAAVLLSLNKNNPIEHATTAVTENDKAEAQSAVTLWVAAIMAEQQASVSFSGDITATAVTASSTNLKISNAAYDADNNSLNTKAQAIFDANTLEDLDLGSLTKVTVVDNKVTVVEK